MNFNVSERLQTKIEHDPLNHVMHLLQMKSVFYTNATFTEPWGLEIPVIPHSMMFHLVVKGQMIVEVDDEKLNLSEGDFIIVPHGNGHIVRSDGTPIIRALEDVPLVCVTERYETLAFGGNGNECKLICGAVSFDHPIADRLASLLPKIMFVGAHKSHLSDTLKSLLGMLADETQRIDIGGEAVITRLADVIIIKIIRDYLLNEADQNVGWYKAIKDPRIGRAIALIHEQPGEDWSLDVLASEAGMSRTAFAGLFKELVGDSPIDYLTNWRMSVAYKKLQMTDEPIISLCMDLGYKSEASFARAFKKIIGDAPGRVRKKYREAK